jgi:multisubunit Na+/H+ antiporter MnhB subunit
VRLVAFSVFFLYGLLLVELARVLFQAPNLPLAAGAAAALALVVLLVSSDLRRQRDRGRQSSRAPRPLKPKGPNDP